MEQIIEVRVAPLEKSHRDTVKILDRFERVLIGDPEYKQGGMVDQVERHEKDITGWNTEMIQFRATVSTALATVKTALGMVKVIMVIGGAIITGIEIALQLWFHGK